MRWVSLADQGIENHEISELGEVRNTTTGRLKKPFYNGAGYMVHSFVVKDGPHKSRKPRVHRLLATAFIENPKNLPCVNHIDGNKLNNSLDNLEWVTYSENSRLAVAAQGGGRRARYTIRCVEHDIIAEGSIDMRRKLLEKGIDAKPRLILYCVDGTSKSYLGLTFEALN